MQIREASIKYRKVGDCKTRNLDSPGKVVSYMLGAYVERPEQESCWVSALDRKNNAKFRHLVTLGTQSNSLVHPREVFKPAIMASASSVIVSHNHPSGDPAPSAADIKVTRELRESGKVLGIPVLDHIIIGEIESDPKARGFYSFQEGGLL